jgi:1-deoxy-D-xylulose-5-phosphate reductoisomerase
MKKSISILGSTGSIGLSTLKIVDKKKEFKIILLSANKNYSLICKQIEKYKPIYFIISNKNIFHKVKKKFIKNKTIIINDFKSIKLKKKINVLVAAIPGIAGLEPTLNLINKTKKILIANKESIICGWDLIKNKAKKTKTKIVPIDSEHFSILKLLENQNLKDIRKIYITASGGPFLNYKLNQLKNVKPKDAINHPKWKMGKKISVDSSTLMNKILEIIEAEKLFNIPNNQLEILIHPESLVHAILKLKNGLTKFIYHETSMIIPLANAIFENDFNIKNYFINKKDNEIKNLTFKKVSPETFPIIKIKRRATEHPSTPIIINAANEILVDQFIKKKIPFLGIIQIILNILNNRNYNKYAIKKPKNIKQVNLINNWAREKTLKIIKQKYE